MGIYSPNMLKTFQTCPKKYYFRFVKGVSMPVNDEMFESGKNIHALASYYLRNENIFKMENSLSESEKLLWEKLKKTAYFGFETIATEYNLSVKIDKHFFGGRLDALVKKDDIYYILDYKTGSAPKDAKYDFQTMIYLLAVRDFFKTENVVFVYIDLKNDKEVVIKLTPELACEYSQKLTDVLNDILKEDFLRKRTDCNCEYSRCCF